MRLEYAVVLIAMNVALLPFSEAAAAEAEATVTYGRNGPGIEATASYEPDPETPPAGSAATGTPSSTGGSSEPQPIAISLHNCIPVYGNGGVPLDYVISDSGGGDCASYSAPEPAEAGKEGPPVPPEELAAAAYDEARSRAGSPRVASAPSRRALVGLPTYVWLDPAPTPIQVDVAVPGLTVTARAAPHRYRWRFGDGRLKETATSGRPWTRERPGDIHHTYRRRDRFSLEVEVVWLAQWSVNGGTWMPLGTFSTYGEREVVVREIVSALARSRR